MYVLTESMLKKFSTKFNSDNINLIKKNAISNNKLVEVIKNVQKTQMRNNVFFKEIDVKVKNTNQKRSGRCWIFAFLNIIRLEMIKKYKLEETFELSQNYLFFWDKLEKSNFFLQTIIETKKHKTDSRLIQHLLTEPVSDGGQWNMLVNIVNKYGIIPKCCMNETYSSSNTGELDYVLNTKLRDMAYDIRTNTMSSKKIETFMEDIYKTLVFFLGEPPRKINWEYYSTIKDKSTYKIIKNISPVQFYKKHIPFDINDMVCLVNAPCKSKPFHNLYDLKYFGNTIEGKKSNFINIPINDMINIAKKSINGNKAIWFGCDVDQYADDNQGILDIEYFNYESMFGKFDKMKKGERLDYCVSRITHAMIIKGYDKINNKITKWLIENSWGDKNEVEGNLIMSNDWFKEFVYEIVVHKKYVPVNILKIQKKKPILLEPWDPLGLLLK